MQSLQNEQGLANNYLSSSQQPEEVSVHFFVGEGVGQGFENVFVDEDSHTLHKRFFR